MSCCSIVFFKWNEHAQFHTQVSPIKQGGLSSHQIIRKPENKKKNLKDDKRGFLEFTEMTVKSWAPVVILNNPFLESNTPDTEQYLLNFYLGKIENYIVLSQSVNIL